MCKLNKEEWLKTWYGKNKRLNRLKWSRIKNNKVSYNRETKKVTQILFMLGGARINWKQQFLFDGDHDKSTFQNHCSFILLYTIKYNNTIQNLFGVITKITYYQSLWPWPPMDSFIFLNLISLIYAIFVMSSYDWSKNFNNSIKEHVCEYIIKESEDI